MPADILAEGSGDSAGTAGLVLLAGLIGGAATWIYGAWKESRKTRRANQIEDDQRDKERSDELYERVCKDRDEAVKREQKAVAAQEFAAAQMTEVRIRMARLYERLGHCKYLLDQAGVKYPKWEDKDPSDTGPPNPGGPADPEPDHDR